MMPPKHLQPGKTNPEDRMNFVDYWAEYVMTHPDKEWSSQQRILIDGQLHHARAWNISPKEYLLQKGEPCLRAKRER